jgi:chromate transporter
LTFGSAAALAALLRDDLVDRLNWLDDGVFALIYALARVTPGTNMLALYAGLGWHLRRWSGVWAALLCASVPPSIIVVLLTVAYESAQGNVLGRAATAGAVAAVVGIIVAGSWLLLKPAVRRGNIARVILLAVGAIVASRQFQFGPLTVIGIAAAIGWVWPERQP